MTTNASITFDNIQYLDDVGPQLRHLLMRAGLENLRPCTAGYALMHVRLKMEALQKELAELKGRPSAVEKLPGWNDAPGAPAERRPEDGPELSISTATVNNIKAILEELEVGWHDGPECTAEALERVKKLLELERTGMIITAVCEPETLTAWNAIPGRPSRCLPGTGPVLSISRASADNIKALLRVLDVDLSQHGHDATQEALERVVDLVGNVKG